MEPVYMNMQSYPNQSGQIHYMMEARPPMSHECWPWVGNYGYAPAGAYRGCCNHAYMPPCAWGSPYSHVPPYPGSYPYLPVQYVPPPSYNVMDHPRYEYEKNLPMQHHCCGCHNHPLQQKEQGNVRIEEEEPEKEKRNNDSLIPSQFKNSPYPIVWLPPDHKEAGKVRNTECRKDASPDVKEHENGKPVKQQPMFWNGWLPLDLNNVVSSKQSGDGENNSHQDGGKGNFRFPFFWMPYKPDDTRRENQKVEDGAKSSLVSQEGCGGGQKFDVNNGNIGDRSTSRVKDIKVKEVEHVGKESSIEKEEGDNFEKDKTNNGEKKIDDVEKVSPVEGSKRKSPSSPKSSKLPPVCLRVDPLPRKKSANGKSRSPSPPGDKQKLEVKSNEAVNDSSLDNEEQVKEGMNKKTIAVVDGNTSLEKSTNVNVKTPGKPDNSQHDASEKQTEGKPEDEVAQKHSESDALNKGQSEDIVAAEGEKEESLKAEEMKTDAVKKCSERELSEEEAAVIIQSTYRGFDVRKWELIQKLREIARVREQIADVKRLVQEMKLSSDIQGREKQKNIIAETIMSLLLRLDTIQGLHPSVREVRKSEVRQLVSLQEQLDTIMNQKPENSPSEESVISLGQEDAPSKSEDHMSSKNSKEIIPVNLQNKIDGGSDTGRAEFLDPNLTDEAASVEIGTGAAVNEGVKDPTVKDKNGRSNEVLEYNETSIANEDHELSSLQGVSTTSTTDLSPADDHDTPKIKLAELPQGVPGELSAAEGTNHSAVEADSSKVDQYMQLEEALIESPVVEESHYEIANKEISDLPLDGVELEIEETGKGGYLDNCNVGCKSGIEGVDNKNEDVTSEPNVCTDQQPQEFVANKIEPFEASDEGELLTATACTGNISTNNELPENCGLTDSAESHVGNEASSQLLQEGYMEESDLINKYSNSGDAANMIRIEDAAAAESNGGMCTAEQSAADMNQSAGASGMSMLSKEVQEQETEHASPKETIAKQELDDEAEHEVSGVGGDMRESNRKLMEENERLRDMMVKLIKSGHEQLTAISSLSGRVKDLEKKLSRKKKVKVKQQSRIKKLS